MVKAAVMAGAGANRGRGRPREVDVDGDYGLPVMHPAVLVPLIGTIILFFGAVACCCCKYNAQKSCSCCGDEASTKKAKLSLRRKCRPSDKKECDKREIQNPKNMSTPLNSFNVIKEVKRQGHSHRSNCAHKHKSSATSDTHSIKMTRAALPYPLLPTTNNHIVAENSTQCTSLEIDEEEALSNNRNDDGKGDKEIFTEGSSGRIEDR